MKGKAISLALIASLLASMLLIGTGSAQYLLGATAKFGIKLPNGGQWMNVTAGPPYDINDLFNITVEIKNVTAMTAYGVSFAWNATYMNATGNYWLSSFFMGQMIAGKWSAASIEYITNDAAAYLGLPIPRRIGLFIGLGQTALAAKNNVTGTFDIVTVEFRINAYGPHGFYIWKDPGLCGAWPYVAFQPYMQQEGMFPPAIHPTYTGWMSPAGKQTYDVQWCPHPLFAPPAPLSGRVSSAMLWIQPPPPRAPTAVKTLSPSFPKVNETVTVTVTQTAPAFNGTAINNINQVTIDYGDLSPTNTSAFTPPSIKFYHAYAAAGPYIIKVYCKAPSQPPDKTWCNLTNPITIIELALTGIDLYQVRHPMWPGDIGGKSGEGPNIPSRPYDPQTLVVLEAYVFYNGEPVQCKIVSFEVRWECENCILYRTDLANETGYARIEFRIPELCWEYGGPEALFGKWCAIVTVEMCEVKYNDTMWFDVGYILTLSNMKSVKSCANTTAWETFKKCDYVSFTVTITNIDWAWVPGVLILVVYDDNEVPIGQEIVPITAPPGEYCKPYMLPVCIALHIPKYAYVGTGTGYINLFTALPFECGLAYCPEVFDQFLILKT